MSKHYRRYRSDSIRLQTWDYTKPSLYYVTICTKNKIKYFGNIENGKMILNEIGKIVKTEWINTKLIRNNIDLDEYIIMPDHLHGIIVIKPDVSIGLENKTSNNSETIHRIVSTHATLKSNSLGSIIGQFKSVCTKHIRKIDKNFGWQNNYYEHIIRNQNDLIRIQKYIELNPANWKDK